MGAIHLLLGLAIGTLASQVIIGLLRLATLPDPDKESARLEAAIKAAMEQMPPVPPLIIHLGV